MTGRKLERDTQNPFGENNQNSKNSASSFNNSLERQKSLGEIGQGLI
jgi:hypothetical protein